MDICHWALLLICLNGNKSINANIMDIIRIGRESDNDIVFAEKEVSRHHCELYCSNDKVYIRDLGSTNGTQVNGRTITTPQCLIKRDRVMLGHKVEIDWSKLWYQFYSYPIITDGFPATIRYGGDGQTVRIDAPLENQPAPSGDNRPLVDIPSSIHVRQEYSDVYRSGDDFKVPFKRNLGNNIGNHVGNTLGCIISIIIVVAILAIVGLIIS